VMRIQLRVFLIMALGGRRNHPNPRAGGSSVSSRIRGSGRRGCRHRLERTRGCGRHERMHRSSRRPIPRVAVELRRGGSGAPLLVIHGELGVPGWLESFAELADHYDVIVPSLPGYGRSTRPDWIMRYLFHLLDRLWPRPPASGRISVRVRPSSISAEMAQPSSIGLSYSNWNSLLCPFGSSPISFALAASRLCARDGARRYGS
jgi:pimeloyl-ACP methyl ester carboxylesterase